MSTYARLPVTFIKGEGAWLWDTDGKRYLDALSGIAVCSLGHAHPAVSKAISDQAAALIHTSNLYGVATQSQLGEKLTRLAGMEKAFFGNSGAEANEAAIKIARRYGHGKGIETPAVIVMESSFHGRTLATLSATGNPKVWNGFGPLVEGFVRVPYNDADAVRKAAAENSNVVAILVEPVQGEGGVNVPAADYLDQLRAVADEHDLLLMLDEIQTGVGRTGTWFAYQHSNIVPDVITVAKALGNGVPIGACLARGKAAEVLQPGTHGTTFGGNPLACAAGLAVLETMEQENIPARATAVGDRMRSGLKDALGDCTTVVDIRGLGAMVGVELDRPCAELVAQALAKGLLINVTAGQTIRLLPPLNMSDAEVDQVVEILAALIREL